MAKANSATTTTATVITEEKALAIREVLSTLFPLASTLPGEKVLPATFEECKLADLDVLCIRAVQALATFESFEKEQRIGSFRKLVTDACAPYVENAEKLSAEYNAASPALRALMGALRPTIDIPVPALVLAKALPAENAVKILTELGFTVKNKKSGFYVVLTMPAKKEEKAA